MRKHLFLPLALLAVIACDDTTTEPQLPESRFVSLDTYGCPAAIQTFDQCDELVESNTLELGRVYVTKAVFENTDYLDVTLAWNARDSRSLCEMDRYGDCRLKRSFGPFDPEAGYQNVAFKLGEPIPYVFIYELLVSDGDDGYYVARDTTLLFYVSGDAEPSPLRTQIF